MKFVVDVENAMVSDAEALRLLVHRMGTGDRSAFQDLYASQADRIRTLVVDSSVSGSEVRTIVSSTFIEAWWLSRFHDHPNENVESWLSEVAMRRVAELRLTRSLGQSKRDRRPWWVDADADWDQLAVRVIRDLLSTGPRVSADAELGESSPA